jgi:hypothetical protein
MCQPAGGRFDGKIVLRKPLDEKEQKLPSGQAGGNGKKKAKAAQA